MAYPGDVAITQMGDLINSGLRELTRLKFSDISENLQRFTAMKNLMTKNRVQISSGWGMQFDVKYVQADYADNSGIAAEDVVNIVDTLTQATFDWRHTKSYYGYYGPELTMNREPAKIVDLLKSRRQDGMKAMARKMEDNFWGAPPSVSDTNTPWGVNTWLVKNATEGFTGTVPSGYTTVGLNPTTYPNWTNWAYPYTNITKDDFVRKTRKAAEFTDWTPPVEYPKAGTADDYGFYTNYGILGPLEEILEAQNENLGADVASQDGKVVFHRTPVIRVPRLEADTTNPFYGINWGVFKTFVLDGYWLKETHLPIYPGQHLASVHFIDCIYQFGCYDKRSCFVGSNGTTYPG